MSDTEINLSLEGELQARTQKVASELGIDAAQLIKTAVLSRFGETEMGTQEPESRKLSGHGDH